MNDIMGLSCNDSYENSVGFKKNCFAYARQIIFLRPIEIRTKKITSKSIYNSNL